MKGEIQTMGLCTKAGVRPFTLKSLRHFVAVRLDDSGKESLTDIQKILGHENATTTDTYLKGLHGQRQSLMRTIWENHSLIKMGHKAVHAQKTNTEKKAYSNHCKPLIFLAERRGFEPPAELPPHTLSRRAP